MCTLYLLVFNQTSKNTNTDVCKEWRLCVIKKNFGYLLSYQY